MTSNLIKISPAPKSEAWKFAPKVLLGKIEFQSPSLVDEKSIKDIKVAIGPSAHQFQAISLFDLVDDGYIKLSVEPPSFIENPNTKRAGLDATIQNVYAASEHIHINIVKALPSNLWVSPNQNFRTVSVSLNAGLTQNICIFENVSPKSQADGFIFNFNIADKATLNLGTALNAPNASFSQINITANEESQVNSFSFLSGETNYKRLEINAFHQGADSNISVNGLCFAVEKSQLDFHSNIFHLNKNQETLQTYKTVGTQSGKSIFSGRIHLTENAGGANVEQLNNNLLLGTKSSVDTQPELNIYQDDVKASHGATTSTIDDNHLFYFASRGFKKDHAKKMLLEAFCKSSFNNLEDPGLSEYFSDLTNGELNRVD